MRFTIEMKNGTEYDIRELLSLDTIEKLEEYINACPQFIKIDEFTIINKLEIREIGIRSEAYDDYINTLGDEDA